MAKDTSKTAKDSGGEEFDRSTNDVVKKGLAKNAARADETIVAQSKDASNASIQAGNESRMKDLPSAGSVPKNPNVSDPLTPKPTVEPLSLGKETRKSKTRVGTGRKEKTGVLRFGTLPVRTEGTSNPASFSVADKPQVISNMVKRQSSGMGLPGSENGDLDLALKLHARDLQEAKSSGKVVNDVSPSDSALTQHGQVYGGHHARYARAMRVLGITDEAVYKNAASAAGMRLPQYITSIHQKIVQHEDSKAPKITHELRGDEFWEHPKTKEIIPVKANHPDMPSSFTRTKGEVNKVTRGPDGSEILERGHEGWVKTRTRGGAGGQEVLRYNTAPTKGVDLIDHLRVQMLSEHGSSTTSRKKGADIANSIADVVSGTVPRGMKRFGKRKVSDGAGGEKYEDVFTPVMRRPNSRAFDKPNPPSPRSGEVLLGSKPPADLPDFSAKGPKMTQPVLPGTGVPKTIAVQTSPQETSLMQGPLTQDRMSRIDMDVPVPAPAKDTAAAQILEQGEPPTYNAESARKKREESRSKAVYGDTGKGSKEEKKNENVYGGFSKLKLDPKKGTLTRGETRIPIENEQDVRTVVTKPAQYTSEVLPTDREWKRQDPNRGQQFPIDTTDMSGAQEVSALKKAGALVPSGSKPKKAKKDKPPVQDSLFPDYSVKEGRKNAFYMAGTPTPISERSKVLQGTADKPFGRQPNNKDFETENEGSLAERTKVGPTDSTEAIMETWRKSNSKKK
jgi:hypothetical protein